MALDTWMGVLKTKLAEVSGLTQVHKYDELPASILTFPTALITLQIGKYEYGADGSAWGWHDVQITLFISDQFLAEAHVLAASFIEPIRNKLAASMKLSGSVAAILPSPEAPTYEGPGEISYGDKKHVGVQFNYRVYVDETGQFTVSQ